MNKNNHIQPTQYIVFKQIEINGLFEKKVFKIVTTDNISSNTRIFNSRFDDEIKTSGTNKAYK